MASLKVERSFTIAPSAESIDVPHLMRIIAERLRSARAREVRLNGDSLVFRGGVTGLSNLHLLIGISRGRVSAHVRSDGVALNYELWFGELAGMAALVAAAALVAGIAMPEIPALAGVVAAVLAIVVLFPLNQVTSALAFRRFLQRCVRKAQAP